MDSKVIKIAVLEDHTLFREVLVKYLVMQKGISVEIQASNFYELKECLSEKKIDILILDIGLPEIPGEEVQKIISEEYPWIRTIVVSMSKDYATINRLFDVGIYGFISKTDCIEELTNAIHSVADSKLYKNKALSETLFWVHENKIIHGKDVNLLTEREIRIIQLLWEEKSNEEIAAILFLGIRSIEKIRQNIKEKLGVKSTIGILKYGISQDILQTYNMGKSHIS